MSIIWISLILNVPIHYIVALVILTGSNNNLLVTVAILSAMAVYLDVQDKKEIRRSLTHDRYYDSEHDIVRQVFFNQVV